MSPSDGEAMSPEPDKQYWKDCWIGCLVLLAFSVVWGILIWCALAEPDEYYSMEITGIRSLNFNEAPDTMVLPSFNITMRVDNHYKEDLYITDWQFAILLDGVPLGHGSFPYDLRVCNMSDNTLTGTTSTVLAGLAKEVHNHISSGKSFNDLEIQVDMRFLVSYVDKSNTIVSTERTWLWCSSGLGARFPPSPCQHLVVIESRDFFGFITHKGSG
jgi:LEA14-like dessication related protein